MSVAWTKEQQKVINLRRRNILVSAAAGSGKTAVLVERIITMLTDEQNPADVDRMLIVTFTEAAAAEMKERIRDAIEKKLPDYPDNERLRQQATLIHSAQITTIHSFCLSVIRDHFHAIDLDPGFRIGEEGELKLLKHDVMGKMLEGRYQEGDKAFLEFVEAYGSGRDDHKVEELILKLYGYSRSYPDPEGWLRMCTSAYEVTDEEELEISHCMALIRQQVKRSTEDVIRILEEGIALCSEPDGPSVYTEALESDLNIAERLRDAGTYREMYKAAGSITWMRLKANRDKSVSEEKTALVKALREDAKSTLKGIAEQYFYQDLKEALTDLALARPAMEALSSLVLEFSVRFQDSKLSQNMIDFGDMEQYALKILTISQDGAFLPSKTALEYQQQYDEILIDEYQDSNLIQEAILTSVSSVSADQYNIFMVGDVKQSIYRFRLSRPELFMEKFHAYSTEDSDCQRIDLHRNFRSRREVLDSVNHIFRQIMTLPLGGIEYDEDAALYVGADFESCGEEGQNNTEVLVINPITQDYEGADTVSDRELEARVIAARIRELLYNHMVLDKKTSEYRKARYSDIVILTRSIKGFSDIFAEVLNREGIPTFAGTREGYFETQEIGVLLDYLRVLNNQRQDIPLAAVLASCMCALTDEELAWIRSADNEVPFCAAVSAYAEEGKEEGIRKKLKKCLSTMEGFRRIVPYTPIHELLVRIMEETGYGDYMAAMPGGEQRKANLDMLVEKARAFESTSYKGLFHFIRYIEQLQKYDVDYGEASIEDEQSDTVRIMTIHKSKGLEFPIVFVSGMGKQFNMQDVRSSVVLHSRLGVGLDAVDTDRRTKSPSLLKKVIQKEEALESLGEELRVLYVALTRAKEKLIVTGTVKNLDKKMQICEMITRQSGRQLSFSRLSRAASYWDWVLPALARIDEGTSIDVHHITVEDLVKEETKELVSERMDLGCLEGWNVEAVYDERMKEHLKEQFSYQYSYGSLAGQKLKFTVSELKKRGHMEEEAGEVLYQEEEVVPLIPEFLKEAEALTGASRGTAYHRVMELLDFTKDYDASSLEEDINTFCSQGKLTRDMAECIRLSDILTFLGSPAGRRIRNAARQGTLWKEQPFVLGLDAKVMYPEEEEGELVLIQGIIDVYFEEDDLVVLDYKTDKVRSAGELADKYQAQLDYYARALEQVTGKKVKEKLIYSFTLMEEIPV